MLHDEDIKTTIEKLYTLRAIISKISIEIERAYDSEHKFSKKEQTIHAAEFYEYYYTSFLLNFKEIIDENEWVNIDIILFLLETRNALTLSEAKKMVDYYERTGEIASIGTIAAKAVRKNIISQPRKIENSIINTICLINKHISYFKNCILISELDNAMTKKANSTSRQMVDDIAQIKCFINRE